MSDLKIAYIGYHSRSCVTGKALAEKLNAIRAGGFIWRRIGSKKRMKYKPAAFLRWGNSVRETPEGAMEINSKEAVEYAASKLLMMKRLLECGIPTPRVILNQGDGGFAQQVVSQCETEDVQSLYIRDSADVVRYGSIYSVSNADKYVSFPVSRRREFRVHIFGGRTIGVYEKLPYEEGTLLMKNETCQFKRLDMSDPDVTKTLKGMRPLAREAVGVLGLVFGGVDVIESMSGSYVATEVNSAPSLNDPNLDRWASEIDNYYREHLAHHLASLEMEDEYASNEDCQEDEEEEFFPEEY